MSRSLRVKLDIGAWRQKERAATTVQISVRQNKKDDHGSFQGVGVAIAAPEDLPKIQTRAQIAAGIYLAAGRAIVDSGMPIVWAKAVYELLQKELGGAMPSRRIGQYYTRVNRRVQLPCIFCGMKHS